MVLFWGERYARGDQLPLQHHQLWEVQQPVQLWWDPSSINHQAHVSKNKAHSVYACVCFQACRYWCTLCRRPSAAGLGGSEQEQTFLITSRFMFAVFVRPAAQVTAIHNSRYVPKKLARSKFKMGLSRHLQCWPQALGTDLICII